jgi:DnaJ like chaperone protein
LGALLGGGRKQRREPHQELDPEARRTAFATAVIVLAAKLAKADGAVSREEVRAFKRLFGIDAGEVDDIAAIFDEAKATPEGFEDYAWQVADLFARDRAVLEQLLDQLFALAAADGDIDPPELEWLGEMAEILGFDDSAFAAVVARFSASQPRPAEQAQPDAYAVLGLMVAADDSDVRERYRMLVREHHPDRLIAQGVPEEMVQWATARLAAINAAYDRIAKERGMS